MSRRSPRMAALGLALVALAACGDGDGDGTGTASGPSTSASASTTSPAGAPTPPAGGAVATTATTANEHDCAPGVESSSAHFDPAGGLYATYLTGLDIGRRTIAFDVVQWLTGDAADEAYAKETGDPGGAPNDLHIVNSSPEVRTAAIAGSVEVWLVRLREDAGASSGKGTLDELPAYLEGYRPAPPDTRLSHNPFWRRLEGGAVTSICEQYVP